MKNPNGYGTCYRLSGNRRKPWIARITAGWKDGKRLFDTLGYYATKEEAEQALKNNGEYGSTVYFISDGDCIKIGKSDNVERRLKEFQTGNSKKLSVVRTIPCKSPKEAYDLEFFFHKMFKPFKQNGEWYKLGGE